MGFTIINTQTVTNAGATISIDVGLQMDAFYIIPDSGAITLAGNIVVNFTGTAVEGRVIRIGWGEGTDINGNTFTVNGVSLTALQALKAGAIEFTYVEGAWGAEYGLSLAGSASLSGAILSAASVALTKLASGTSAQVIVCDGSGVPTYVALSGDVTVSNAGVAAIGTGVIVNADVNAAAAIAVSKLAALTASRIVSTNASGILEAGAGSVIVNADVAAAAAIARTKLASGTADHVLINDASGVASSEAQLAEVRGGTGLDTSASTGVVTIAAGTWAVGARTEVMLLEVSFETGEVGDFKITMPFAGTVTSIYAYATKAIAGTDNGTIVPKNAAGTTMTSGTVTFTASDARGTAYTTTPSANNTFSAADVLTFTTAKTTAGGKVQLSITFTRTT